MYEGPKVSNGLSLDVQTTELQARNNQSRQHWHKEKEFIPSGEQQKMEELKEGWRDAVDRVLER